MLTGEWVLLGISVGSLVMSGGVLWWAKTEIEDLRSTQYNHRRDIKFLTDVFQKTDRNLREVTFRVDGLDDSLQGSVGEIWSSVIDSTGVEELKEQVKELESNVYDKYIMENLWEQNEATKDYAKKQKRKDSVLSALREESPVHSVNKAKENLT